MMGIVNNYQKNYPQLVEDINLVVKEQEKIISHFLKFRQKNYGINEVFAFATKHLMQDCKPAQQEAKPAEEQPNFKRFSINS